MEPWLIYILVFGLVVLAVLQFQLGVGGMVRGRNQARRRFETLAPAGPTAELEVLRRRQSRLGQSAPVLRLNRLVLQSGTTLSIGALGAVAGGLALVLFILLPFPNDAVLRLTAACLGGALLVGLWLRVKRARRMARFGEQLPEVLDVIVRSLRAGHPLPVALGLVVREMPEPAGPEFALVIDEVNYGRSMAQALENLHERVGYPELRFFVASTSIAQQTGGNLGEILSRLSAMLRERFRLSRRVRALSAEGRFSGYALSVLPVALFLLINVVSPAYYADFWLNASSSSVLAVCLILLIMGNAIIYRLVNFKV